MRAAGDQGRSPAGASSGSIGRGEPVERSWAARCRSSRAITFGARGGGIGQALPGALGVKLAHPTRPVVAISGDGSAMYSIQALWTAAQHDLAVVFVILDNREYRILKHNMDAYRQRFGVRSERPYAHMDLSKPDLSFVDIAHGMGVPGSRVTKPGDLGPALTAAPESAGPYLLDVVVEGRR